jgi:hypothetical protein
MPTALPDRPLVTYLSIQKPFKLSLDSLSVQYSCAFSNFLSSVINSPWKAPLFVNFVCQMKVAIEDRQE